MLQTFEVANIRCGGCAATIRTALGMEGFISVKVDLIPDPRTVTAEIEDEERLELFKAVLKKHGYPLYNEERGFTEDALLKAKSVVSCAIGKIK